MAIRVMLYLMTVILGHSYFCALPLARTGTSLALTQALFCGTELLTVLA